jgi:hypothetical protein
MRNLKKYIKNKFGTGMPFEMIAGLILALILIFVLAWFFYNNYDTKQITDTGSSLIDNAIEKSSEK